MSWLRRTFLTGIIVTVPLIVTLVTLVWIFQFVDAIATPVSARVLGQAVPGLGVLITAGFVLAVGVVATNVIGRRVLATAESWLLLVPVFKTIYAPVKQLVAAFSPGNEAGFKRVVLVEDPRRVLAMGFLTREFTLDRGEGPEQMIAVFVPTNHLYLGDVVVVPRAKAIFPDVTVEEGIRIFLTGGMALPERMHELTRTGEHADET
ncbi:MAG TPA: DUF502 domain-containing protein [Vicinamibacterales bacterium]|jgi:uncharacterized membrane protein|nr:DUF502 domain-containing protein [Vicinamibacterales bacterium]